MWTHAFHWKKILVLVFCDLYKCILWLITKINIQIFQGFLKYFHWYRYIHIFLKILNFYSHICEYKFFFNEWIEIWPRVFGCVCNYSELQAFLFPEWSMKCETKKRKQKQRKNLKQRKTHQIKKANDKYYVLNWILFREEEHFTELKLHETKRTDG